MRPSLRVSLATAVVVTLTGGFLSATEGPAAAAPASLADDFNGDGYRDLAVGMPEKTVNGHKRAGAVVVTFGSSTGLTSKHVVVTQDSTGVPGAAETEDLFGTDLSNGDLDGDGYADLLVTSEREKVGDLSERGSVTVLWGGSTGFRSGTTLPTALSYKEQWFGTDTAVGDFVGDASPDVVVSDSASLWLFEGGFRRTSIPAPIDVDRRPGNDYGFGQLAAGDFTGDGKDELAVAAPGATVIFSEDAEGFHDEQALGGGTTLTTGDLNGDGRDDLAVGLPDPYLDDNHLTDPSGNAGYVTTYYGGGTAPGGLKTTRHTFHQNTSGIPGTNESGDEFGAALSIADINGDGPAELAIGIPCESFDSAHCGGDVLVLRGSASGTVTTGATRYSQNSSNVPGTAENNDTFGYRILLADFNRNGKADLAVSAPGENVVNNVGSGALWQLHGAAGGLTTTGTDVFNPADYGVSTGSRLGDALGD
ncbi:FG-GAP-like repeat-containing protein [Streptomyces sp. NPDC048508]|uniref:FG-GAP-like repeat-containing protein n=1 Tax=Streptomyces sp. NPDC048508 TaxID=3365561 RepID=UPI003717A662